MKWKDALAATQRWAGEKTTIAGLGVLASTATGYFSHTLTPDQALMGVAGALCLMIFRENLQTLLASVETSADGATSAKASVSSDAAKPAEPVAPATDPAHAAIAAAVVEALRAAGALPVQPPAPPVPAATAITAVPAA